MRAECIPSAGPSQDTALPCRGIVCGSPIPRLPRTLVLSTRPLSLCPPPHPFFCLRDNVWNLNTGVRMTSPARLVGSSIGSHRPRALDVRRFATGTVIVRYRCACHWLTKTLMSKSRPGTPRTRSVLPPIHHFALALHYPSDVDSLYDGVDASSLPDSIWLDCSKDILQTNNKRGEVQNMVLGWYLSQRSTKGCILSWI